MAYLTIEELKSNPGLLPEIRDSEDISNLEFTVLFFDKKLYWNT